MYCLYIQVVLLVMLLSAQDLFTCLAHIIYIYIYIAYIFRSWEVWSCSCRRRTDLHVLQILNIYIYMYCLYIQVVLLVMLLSAQDLFTCLAHIIYIYTLLIYSGDASGHASVGAGLIYMSCTYYIYIYIACIFR